MSDQEVRSVSVLVHGGGGRVGGRVVEMASRTPGVDVVGLLDLRARRSEEKLAELPVFDDIPRGEPRVDVVIDFSRCEAVGPLVEALHGSAIRLVSGTTGLDAKTRSCLKAHSEECAVFYDENMSYGVSTMKRLLETAGTLFRDFADVEIVEFHHRHKSDCPSGTVFALGRAIDPEKVVVTGRGTAKTEGRGAIHAHSVRIGGIPGDHQVYFATDEEVVTIGHRALSRDVFARGALRAARFIVDKTTGMFSMRDLTGV